MTLRYCRFAESEEGCEFKRVLENSESHSVKWLDRKTHMAGVTAAVALTEELVVTGSYDDHIRVISTGRSGKRQVLAEKNLGGGVWRIKVISPHTGMPDLSTKSELRMIVLASCMHAGVRLVEICRSLEDVWSLALIGRFEEHQSMNYASDALPVSEGSMRTFVSSSFYDKLVCVWRHQL